MALAPIVIQIKSQGAPQAASDITRVADAAHGLGSAGTDAAAGLNQAGGALGDLDANAQAAADSADRVTARFERMRNIGAVITGIGAGALALSSNLRDVAEGGNSVEARLEALAKAQGRLGDVDHINDVIANVTVKAHLPDDDPVREAVVQMMSDQVATVDLPDLLEAAARNAETLKQPIDAIGTGMAKAYGELSLNRLKKMNILFDEGAQDAVDAAAGISKAAGQAEFMRQVMDSTAKSTGELGTGLTDAAKAAGDAARKYDDFQTTIGTGSAEAHTAIQTNVLIPLLDIANAHPGLLKTAGGVLEIGGNVAAIGGPMLGLVGQIGMARLGFAGMGTTAIAAFSSAAKAALAAAPAIWAAIAPILPLILAIAAGVLLVVGGLYLWAKADLDKAAADSKAADAADKEFFDKQSARRDAGKTSDVNAGETFEQWRKRKGRGSEGPDDGSGTDDVSALTDLKAQLDAMKGGAPTAPAMPTGVPVAVAAPSSTATGATFAVSNAPGATNGVPDTDPYADQIRELTRQKRDLKGKSNAAARDALQAQIDGLKDSERNWKEAHKAQTEARKAQNKADKGAAALAKIKADARTDAQIDALGDELDEAKKSGDLVKVRALTLQIELANAEKKHADALISANAQGDAAAQGMAIDAANAQFEADKAAATRKASHASDAYSESENEKWDKGTNNIDKIHAQGKYAAQIADAEDQLEKAKDDKDLAKIELLTRRIEMTKARQKLDEAMADAELLKNQNEIDVAVATAQAQFDNDEAAANRAARHARRDAEKGDKGKVSDSAIRAQLAAMKMQPGFNVPALGSGINYGDRFAEAEALSPRYNVGPAFGSFAASYPQPQSQNNNTSEARGRGRKRSAEFTVEAESYRQNGRGDYEIKLKGGTITVPYMGLSEASD